MLDVRAEDKGSMRLNIRGSDKLDAARLPSFEVGVMQTSKQWVTAVED